MNGLTLELFRTVKVLDEKGLQMAFGWLSALLKLPYLDSTEKGNAIILLDYLEALEGSGVLAPMLRDARVKLSLEVPMPWDMEWPENYQVSVNGEKLSPEDLRRRGIPYVDFRLNKPIRSSLEYSLTRRIHSDGRIELLPEYQVFTAPPVGERHLFHAYGEKAVQTAGG